MSFLQKIFGSLLGNPRCVSQSKEEMAGDSSVSTCPCNKFDAGIVPKHIDGVPIVYRYYDIRISDVNKEVYNLISESGSFELSASEQDGQISFYWNGSFYATLTDQAHSSMLLDWIHSGEPYKAYASGDQTVYLAFYRNKREKLAHRDQSIVKLTAYSSCSKQDEISCLDSMDELTLSEDYNDNGNLFVSVESSGDEIGKLPKSIAKKYVDEGASACFFEKAEYDEESDKYIPYVRIFW